MIVIDEKGDLIIRVFEDPKAVKEIEAASAIDSNSRVHGIEDFQVNRSTLIEHSPVFKKNLTGGFAEGDKTVVEAKEDRIISMEILLRVIHGASLQDVLRVSIDEMWPLVVAVDKYDVDIALFQTWFHEWYKALKIDTSDVDTGHAFGIARATRILAYNVIGHIVEKNPTKHKQLHLPSRVIRKLRSFQNNCCPNELTNS